LWRLLLTTLALLALSSGCTSAGVGDGSDGAEPNAGLRVPLPDPCALVSAQTAMSLVGPTLGVPGNDFFLQKGVGAPDELDELDDLADLHVPPLDASGASMKVSRKDRGGHDGSEWARVDVRGLPAKPYGVATDLDDYADPVAGLGDSARQCTWSHNGTHGLIIRFAVDETVITIDYASTPAGSGAGAQNHEAELLKRVREAAHATAARLTADRQSDGGE
jgi:hypothetical protein